MAMIIDGDRLIRMLEDLQEQTTGKVCVLKEPAVYARLIELIKHMGSGIEPVPEQNGTYTSYHCAVCGYPLFTRDDRCEWCGTKVNWPEHVKR